MNKNKKFLNIQITLIFFLFFYNPYRAFADDFLRTRVLSLSKGAHVFYESSSFSLKWTARHLIGGADKRGWRAKEKTPFPHVIIFELASNADIDLLRFKNNTNETKFPGISAKEVEIEFSTESPNSGYIPVGAFILEKKQEPQEFTIQKSKARWIRLSIKSNYGHSQYTELMEFEAWGVFEFKILRIIANFVWILGIALILSVFSYHEFLAHVQKAKIIKVFKRDSFKRLFLLGMILVASGISASTKRLWLIIIFGILSLSLIVWFIRVIKIRPARNQEEID